MQVRVSVYVTAIAAAGLVLLAGCEKPPTPGGGAPPSPATIPPARATEGDWVMSAAPSGATSVSATRSIALEGGGSIELRLACDNRDNSDALQRGYWLALELAAKDDEGKFIALSRDAYDGDTVRLNVTRSTGEDGSIMLTPGAGGSPVYANNQTNELSQDNNDPAKVEMPREIALPLADGRNVVVKTASESADYAALMTACKALARVPAAH